VLTEQRVPLAAPATSAAEADRELTSAESHQQPDTAPAATHNMGAYLRHKRYTHAVPLSSLAQYTLPPIRQWANPNTNRNKYQGQHRSILLIYLLFNMFSYTKKQ